MLSKLIFTLFSVAASVKATAAAPQNTSAVNFVSLVPIGNVAAFQPGVNTWLYYQDSTGAIRQYGLTPGPFTTAHTTRNGLIVPAGQALIGTPIVVTGTPGGDSASGEHVYFLSPNYVLSEYRWDGAKGWSGGSGCTDCIDRAGFQVTWGSSVLYALQDPSTNTLRVGFVSPGNPGTLVEAVSTNSGASWVLAPLPA